jgi:hypothetical protein
VLLTLVPAVAVAVAVAASAALVVGQPTFQVDRVLPELL